MADEFLTKFYLGLADVLSASVLTPREKKLIEIINKQNAALEAIAVGTLTKSPQEIANLAKGATVVIVEKGEEPVPMAQYAAKVSAENPAETRQEPTENPAKPVDKSVQERIKAFSAAPAAGKPKLVDLPPPPEVPTTVGGGTAGYSRRSDVLPVFILAVTTLCSVAAVAVGVR